MLKAEVVAKYFLNKDSKNILFNENNNRLNKYLFLTQVVYLACYNKKLISDDFLADNDGPVVKENIIVNKEKVIIPSDIKKFLNKIYESLENATDKELIEIIHEDPVWLKLSSNTFNTPIMDLEKNIKEYKQRYKGLIQALKLNHN